jgi:hypothetical protein
VSSCDWPSEFAGLQDSVFGVYGGCERCWLLPAGGRPYGKWSPGQRFVGATLQGESERPALEGVTVATSRWGATVAELHASRRALFLVETYMRDAHGSSLRRFVNSPGPCQICAYRTSFALQRNRLCVPTLCGTAVAVRW